MDFGFFDADTSLTFSAALVAIDRHRLAAKLKFTCVGLPKPIVQRQDTDPERFGGLL